MRNEVFDNLSQKLNTKYEEDPIMNEIEELKNKKEQFVQSKVVTDDSMEDVEYMKFELKSLITCGRNILEKLEEDIKVGSKVRNHEVYFLGINSLRDILKELRELNKTVVDLKLKSKMTNTLSDLPKGDSILMGSKELLQLIKTAQSNSQMNEIKAEFKIVD